ncbi:MAG: hypothetical protein CMB80_04980 [Flammeovirgaceae bacterium]|nr:hypothetical protein [Flammeovirgaceae bacterium]
MQKFFRKIRDVTKRVKKAGRDVFSGIKDNPEALMLAAAMYGIPAMMGGASTTTGGSGFGNFMKKMLGTFGTKASGSGPDEIFGTEASGLAGILKKIGGGLSGVTGGSGKGIEGNAGLISLIMSMLAKKQFEKEKEGPLDKSERLSEIDIKYDDITGGSPFAKDRFRGTHWDPVTKKYYDEKTPEGEFKNYDIDEEGKVIEYIPPTTQAQGGIVGLQAGGNPFMNRGTMRGSIGGGMPGGRDPTVEGIMGYNPNVVRRARGGSTAGDLADRLEENPGIAQFFPRKFGAISGPGGPKEDKIPAMLSDGEFVMTAKAVDNAGGPKSMYNLMNRLDPDSSRGRGIV